MKTDSPDDTYNALIETLRNRVAALARKIEPKVYAYGFLKVGVVISRIEATAE